MRTGVAWAVVWIACGVVACGVVACGSGSERPKSRAGAGTAEATTGGAPGLGGSGSSGGTGGVGGAGGNTTLDAGAAGGAGQPWGNPAWGEANCPAVPDGVSVGLLTNDYLKGISVKSCEGEAISLDSFCGATATWLFLAHGWCPHCKAVSAMAESIHDSYAGANLASAVILVEGATGKPPTAADCATWREAYGLEDVAMLYDPTGVTQPLYEQPYTALNVFVDSARTIRVKVHTDLEASIRNQLEQLLGL